MAAKPRSYTRKQRERQVCRRSAGILACSRRASLPGGGNSRDEVSLIAYRFDWQTYHPETAISPQSSRFLSCQVAAELSRWAAVTSCPDDRGVTVGRGRPTGEGKDACGTRHRSPRSPAPFVKFSTPRSVGRVLAAAELELIRPYGIHRHPRCPRAQPQEHRRRRSAQQVR